MEAKGDGKKHACFNKTLPVYDLSFDSTIVKFYFETKEEVPQKSPQKSSEKILLEVWQKHVVVMI